MRSLALVAVVGGLASLMPPASKPTYVRDVAPILNRSCVSCHRPGQAGPFRLDSYAAAKKRSHTIAAAVATGAMPPFRARHGYGEFQDDPRLSASDKETLEAWAATGAPRGKGEPPAPPAFPPAGKWPFGEPSRELVMDREIVLSADGDDVYRNYVFRNEEKVSRWVTGIDVRPGNRTAVHHVIAFLDQAQAGRKLEAETKDGQPGYPSSGGGVGFLPSGSLGGWAPGMPPQRTDPGTAFEIRPGEDIVLQVHYSRSGKVEKDRTKVALYFSDTPPARKLEILWQATWIDIPAGKKDYFRKSDFTVPVDATIYATLPHMHLLGRTMKAWVETPGGDKLPLVAIDDWDFGWQYNYRLKTPMKVPRGSKIHVEAHYDNSDENPRNPNHPPKRVKYGERTADEMFLLVTTYSRD